MTTLTAAHVSALCDGAHPSTVPTLDASKRNLHQIIGLDVCTTLTRLDLSDNKLSSIEGIALCANLRWLSVSGNLLKSLKGVEGFTHLTVLNGSRNQLTSTTQVIGLSQLRALILNNNLITAVDRLDNLKNLNTLVLSNNPIRTLGNFANRLSSLTKLSMSHCEIQVLGASLRKCVALREVRLAHNNLSVLPKELERNGQLRILDVGNNELHNWADLQVLSTISSLKILNLKGNKLCTQNQYTCKVLQLIPSLEILDGRPVEAYAIKGKSIDSTSEPKMKKGIKRQIGNSMSTDAGVNVVQGDEQKPFMELITQQSTTLASLSVGDNYSEAAKTSQLTSRPGCANGSKNIVDTSRKILRGFSGFEVGLGGSSTWETGSKLLKPSEPVHTQPNVCSSRPVYRRWDLKGKQ